MSADAVANKKQYFTISDLARRHNVSLRTLRFYEDRGLLNPTRLGQLRMYSVKDEIRLQLVITGKRLGLSLRCIADLIRDRSGIVQDEPTNMATLLDSDALQAQLTALQSQKAQIDGAIAQLEQVISSKRRLVAVA